MRGNRYGLIIGAPRSGTTLMTIVLNRHPSLFVLFENKCLSKMLKDIDSNCDNYGQLRTYVNSKLSKIEETPLSLTSKVQERLFARNDNDSPKDSLLDLYSHLGYKDDHKEQANYYLDKNPGYSFVLDKIERNIHPSSYIWMIRDFRAFIASRVEKKKKNARLTNPFYLGYLWNEFTKEYIRQNEKLGDRMILVSYEGFVSEPEKEIRKICDFLGVEYLDHLVDEQGDDNVSDFANLVNERRIQKFSDLQKDFYTDRIEAWKKTIKPKLERRLISICGSTYNKVYPESLSSSGKLYDLWVRLTSFHWLLIAKIQVMRMRRS